jgi:3-dehydroquinate dehydratase-2
MKKLLILNGPNLNLTGIRETEIYGIKSFDELIAEIRIKYADLEVVYRQSNVEGELINYLHEFGFSVDGIVFNPGAYAHTSVALADAVRAIIAPVAEVHLSNIYAREDYRHIMLTATAAKACISGLGMFGYEAAIGYLMGS